MIRTATLPAILRYLRRTHGLTQAAVGEVVGVGDSCVSQWESGLRRVPLDALNAILSLYGYKAFIRVEWVRDVDKTLVVEPK